MRLGGMVICKETFINDRGDLFNSNPNFKYIKGESYIIEDFDLSDITGDYVRIVDVWFELETSTVRDIEYNKFCDYFYTAKELRKKKLESLGSNL